MTDYKLGGTTLTELTGPAADDRVLALKKSNTTTAPADADGSNQWASFLTIAKSVGFLAKAKKTLLPSGDTSGAADVTAINNVTANGGVAELAWTGTDWVGGQTPFYVASDLLFDTGGGIEGQVPWHSSEADNYGVGAGTSGGSVIIAVGTFAGSAVINLTNAGGTQKHGVSLRNFSIDGASVMPAGHGILVDGAWGACVMDGVCVNGPFADCLHFQTDVTSSKDPDDWRVVNCKFSGSFTGNGVYVPNLPDSWFIDCESSENALDNWVVNYSLNTRLIGCKGENSAGGHGFNLGGQGGSGRAVQLIGCSTHLNYKSGFAFVNEGAATGGRYLLVGCVSIDDNQAGGTAYSSFDAFGSPAIVEGTGCYASGAAYGAAQASGSAGMKFSGGSDLNGATGKVNDDGSNTTPLQWSDAAPPHQQKVTLQTAFNSATGTSAQNVTGMAAALAPGTYEVSAWIPMTPHGTTGSTQTLAWSFSGTATSAAGTWKIAGPSGITSSVITTITTASAVSPTMTSTGLIGEFRGRVVVSASGTLQLTVKSTTSGDEVTIPVGAVIEVKPSL